MAMPSHLLAMDTSTISLVVWAALIPLSFVVLGAVRRLYFHPLSHIPGPKLAALSNTINLAYKGPVIRVSPNEVSFSSPQSWTDIYAPRKGNEFIKSAFYDGGNFADQAHSIVSERDPAKHAQMRKFLSRAFSDQSLREQEGMISNVITKFVDKVGQVSEQDGSVDLTKWFNLMTFDIIGLLAFGQDFEGIESGKTHHWIDDVLGSMSQANFSDTFSRFPWVGKVYMFFRPDWLNSLMAASQRHQTYTMRITKQFVTISPLIAIFRVSYSV
ncbi:putative cytochrome P450 [Curvularia clavata]|uniref:Cytochrome P450 n=1 Tax=Curvularia clavata TaxID=95742 RepID=A0A9Q8Z2W5_CURCL|nr:putative cytochrome P450 [Curvularia clavata]